MSSSTMDILSLAKDVKFTIDRVLNPDQKSPERSQHAAIKDVEVIDTIHLSIHISPIPYYLNDLQISR